MYSVYLVMFGPLFIHFSVFAYTIITFELITLLQGEALKTMPVENMVEHSMVNRRTVPSSILRL